MTFFSQRWELTDLTWRTQCFSMPSETQHICSGDVPFTHAQSFPSPKATNIFCKAIFLNSFWTPHSKAPVCFISIGNAETGIHFWPANTGKKEVVTAPAVHNSSATYFLNDCQFTMKKMWNQSHSTALPLFYITRFILIEKIINYIASPFG